MKINKGNDAFYFGCKNNKVGHYLHDETLRAIHSNTSGSINWGLKL